MDPIRRLVVALALSLGFLALAPDPGGARVTLHPGIEFGMGRSSVDYDNPLPFWHNGWATSFTAGARVELRWGRHLGVLSGARFTHAGNRVGYAAVAGSGYPPQHGMFGIRADEIRVPLLLRLSPYGARRLRLTFGPEAAFVTAAHFRLARHVETSGPFPATDEARTVNIISHVRTSRLDARAGVGWVFPLLGHRGLLDLRATRALTAGARPADRFSTWKPFDLMLVSGIDW